MKRILFALLAATALQASVSAQTTTIKDANAEPRDARNFHGIRIGNSFDVFLSQGNEESVAVSASDTKYLADIKVEVKDGILHISYEPKTGRWNSGNKKLKAYISFKQISTLNVSGACDVDVIGAWKADDLKIDLSGASDLKGKLEAKKLDIDLSGASDMVVTGSAGQIAIEASGASSFKGFDLVTDYCDARASGASDIRITVNKELSAQATGASDIDYKGEGVIRDLKSSGASSVSKKNS